MRYLCRICVVCLGFLLCAGSHQAAESPQEFNIGKVRYGIFYLPGLAEKTHEPVTFRNGKPVCDVSEYKWVDKMFLELSQAGINMATFAMVHSWFGSVFPSDIPEVSYDEQWHGIDPLEDFLKASTKYDLDVFLSNMIRFKSMEYTKNALKELAEKYGNHTQVVGFVPPFEVSYGDFNEMASFVKGLNPRWKIMDFPLGPYSSRAFASAIHHGNHRDVDIENIQYKAAPPHLFTNDFMGVRGMTQGVKGAVPGKEVLVHTHYVVEGGLPYMVPSQAYHVRQGALLTSTPDGTHQFGFPEGFWGEVDFRTGDPVLWRATEWYKGILNVQRLAPLYGKAENTAKVAIMIPRYPVTGLPDLVERSWLHLVRRQIPVRFFLTRENMGNPEIIIVPYTQGLSVEQIQLLREFTARGGTTIAITGRVEPPSFIKTVMKANADTSQNDLRLSEIFGFGMYPDYLKKTPVFVWNEPIIFKHYFNEGLGIAVSGYSRIVPIFFPDIVQENLRSSLQVSGLPKNIIVERYEKRGQGNHEFILFLGTDENSKGIGGTLCIPGADAADRYYWVTHNEVKQIQLQQKDAGAVCDLPMIEEWAGVLRTGKDGTFPLLLPAKVYQECRRGETIDMSVTLYNTYGKSISGTMHVDVPPEWDVVSGQDQSYTLQVDEQQIFQIQVAVPYAVEKRGKFVKFSTLGLEQRTMVLAVDGDPHKVTDREPPPLNNQPILIRQY